MTERPVHPFHAGRFHLRLGHETKLMGVLNLTPDSFSDGGLFTAPDRALKQALKMEREGAHILNIGGESSRPGSKPVSAKEEIRRVIPVLKKLGKVIQIPISVDTYKYEVAEAALGEGAVIVNDIFALRKDKRMAKLVAKHKAGVVLMHMPGTPETMQTKTNYRDLLKDILNYLKKSVTLALDAGVAKTSIAVDPGFGFGKTAQQNLEILERLEAFLKLKMPVLAGLSRKSFIGQTLGVGVEDRLYGSLGAAAAAVQRGAHILRVHDVLPHRHVCGILDRASEARAA